MVTQAQRCPQSGNLAVAAGSGQAGKIAVCFFPKPSPADSFRHASLLAPPSRRSVPIGCMRSNTTAIASSSAATATACGCSLDAAMTGATAILPSRALRRSCGIPAREGLGAGFGWRVAFAFSGGEDPDPRRLQPLTRNLGWGWLAGLANHPGTVRDYFPQSPTSKVREWAFRQL